MYSLNNIISQIIFQAFIQGREGRFSQIGIIFLFFSLTMLS